MSLLKTLKHIFHPQRSNNHRSKFLHPKPLLFLTIIAVGFYQLVGITATAHSISGNILGYASNIQVLQVVESTNSVRKASGLQTLVYNNQLAQAATAKAQNMFAEDYWSHTSPTGVEPWDFIKNAGYVYKIAGENLARDFDTTAPMMDAWMNSPTHRANIMNPRYEEIGIAVVDGLLNGIETTLVVQMFGSPTTNTAKQPSIEVPAAVSVITEKVDEEVAQNQGETDLVIQEQNQALLDNSVLARTSVPQGSLSNGILYSPQHVLKAFFLSIIIILLVVLIYDALIAGHRDSVRFVGKNLAHIMLFVTVAYVILVFKGGVVGP